VILKLSLTRDRLIFHYQDGNIYAFESGCCGLNDLKKDGTFVGSSGADSIDQAYFSYFCQKQDDGWKAYPEKAFEANFVKVRQAGIRSGDSSKAIYK
jgi:hypothetical protein